MRWSRKEKPTIRREEEEPYIDMALSLLKQRVRRLEDRVNRHVFPERKPKQDSA
jgi:hypothetical protein